MGRTTPYPAWRRTAAVALGAAALAAATPLAALAAPSPFGPGDEAGNTNFEGPATFKRAARAMLKPGAQSYRLAHLFSPRMPQSPFAAPWTQTPNPTAFIGEHAGNGEVISGDIGGQGTQMDALGHFGHRPTGSDQVAYFNGFTQDEVVGPSGLTKLGIEKSKPIVTTALLLDAQRFLGHGNPLPAGRIITGADIEAMRRAEHLPRIKPGDVVFIYTGWSRQWRDDNPNPLATAYYSAGPGIARSAAEFLASKRPALVGLDNPFTDAVNDGFLTGTAGPPAENPPGLPFFAHHNNLKEAGIHQIQNLDLEALARDRVYLSAVFISPLPIRGGAASPVAPVAVGAPRH